MHGIDIDPDCARVAEERVVPHIGDQADVGFLRQVVREMGRVDVVIDDGGHHSSLQIATFEALYPLVDPNGVYLCEDTRASYWGHYGGGYRKRALSSSMPRPSSSRCTPGTSRTMGLPETRPLPG